MIRLFYYMAVDLCLFKWIPWIVYYLIQSMKSIPNGLKTPHNFLFKRFWDWNGD